MNGFSAAQTIIAAMITPALVILASGSLIATALVRLPRVVDRVRGLSRWRDTGVSKDDLDRHERRALLTERAIGLYFWAVPGKADSVQGRITGRCRVRRLTALGVAMPSAEADALPTGRP